MNRIPITGKWHRTEIPTLKILSVTICLQLIPGEFRIKFIGVLREPKNLLTNIKM
jgi:hypothetical protein